MVAMKVLRFVSALCVALSVGASVGYVIGGLF
jgi:hypothetical protein